MEKYVAIASIASPIIAAIALIFAFTGPLKKTAGKELSFGRIYKGLLVAASKTISDEVVITYRGHAVTRLYALTLSLMNTGKVEISTSDFQNPPKIIFSGVKKIFSAEVIRCVPNYLEPDISIEGSDHIIINPMLLNSGDFISLRVVVEGDDFVDAVFAARVTGVKNFPRLSAGAHPGYDLFGLAFLLILSCGSLAGNYHFLQKGVASAFFWLGLVMVILPFGALIVWIKDVLKTRKSRWMGEDTKDLAVGSNFI